MYRIHRTTGGAVVLIFIAAASIMMLLHFDDNAVHAYEDTKITLDFRCGDTLYLENKERVMYVDILIENYDPSDGRYSMTVTHYGKTVMEKDVFPEDYGNDLWMASESYPLYGQSTEPSGEHKVHVRTESGSTMGTATFYVDKSTPPPGRQQEGECLSKFLDSTEPVTNTPVDHMESVLGMYDLFLEMMFETEQRREIFTTFFMPFLFFVILVAVVKWALGRKKRHGKATGYDQFQAQQHYTPKYPLHSDYSRIRYRPTQDQNTGVSETHYKPGTSHKIPEEGREDTRILDIVGKNRIMVDSNVLISYAKRRNGEEDDLENCPPETAKIIKEKPHIVDISPEAWQEYIGPKLPDEEYDKLKSCVVGYKMEYDDENVVFLNEMYRNLADNFESKKATEWLKHKATNVGKILEKKGHKNLPWQKDRKDDKRLVDIDKLDGDLKKEAIEVLRQKVKKDIKIVASAMRQAKHDDVFLLSSDGEIAYFADEISNKTDGKLKILRPIEFEDKITRKL